LSPIGCKAKRNYRKAAQFAFVQKLAHKMLTPEFPLGVVTVVQGACWIIPYYTLYARLFAETETDCRQLIDSL
jgi:hypothetical protein